MYCADCDTAFSAIRMIHDNDASLHYQRIDALLAESPSTANDAKTPRALFLDAVAPTMLQPQETVAHMIARYETVRKVAIRVVSGYLWFFNTTAADTSLQEERDRVKTFIDIVSGEETSRNAASMKRALKPLVKVMGDEYRFHLQPKRVYVAAVLGRLLGSASFLTAIHSMKAIGDMQEATSTADEDDFPLPVMVIYPPPGKAAAQRVLDVLLELFSEFSPEELRHMTLPNKARFSHKVNDMVYYVNFSGDAKKAYATMLTRGGRTRKNTLFTEDYAALKTGLLSR